MSPTKRAPVWPLILIPIIISVVIILAALAVKAAPPQNVPERGSAEWDRIPRTTAATPPPSMTVRSYSRSEFEAEKARERQDGLFATLRRIEAKLDLLLESR